MKRIQKWLPMFDCHQRNAWIQTSVAMIAHRHTAHFLVNVFAVAMLCDVNAANDDNWPQFRGGSASGVANGNPPDEWDLASGENVAWNIALPGIGHSSPVVWGNQVFVTTAIDTANDRPTIGVGWLGGTGDPAEDGDDWIWQIHAYDLATGELNWSVDACRGTPEIKRHLKATHANCSVATDGERLVAFFGSEGLFCFDLDGELLWQYSFGRLHSGPYNAEELEWGFASSPVIFEDNVIVQCDCLNESFVAVLDLQTGQERRRITREDVATWSTPLVFRHEGVAQIVCNGYREMAAFDLETGERLWFLSGGGDVPVPSPLLAEDTIIITNGHGRSPTYAIAIDARGELTPYNRREDIDSSSTGSATSEAENQPDQSASDNLPPGLKWFAPRDGAYMPTPIAIGDYLYTCNDNGRLVVRQLDDGEVVYRQRIGRSGATFTASAVGTADRIYLCDEAGVVYMLSTGREFQPPNRSEVGEPVLATPAISGNRLVIRTINSLICLE